MFIDQRRRLGIGVVTNRLGNWRARMIEHEKLA